MKALIPLIPVLLLGLIACGPRKSAGESSAEMDPAPAFPALVIDSNRTASEGDAFTVQGQPVVREQTLEVVVQYGGGCRDHEWELVSRGLWKKSLPPQLDMVLIHNANGDMCRALITDTLRFDLSPARRDGDQRARLWLRNGGDFALDVVW